jgi:hypothetical protein
MIFLQIQIACYERIGEPFGFMSGGGDETRFRIGGGDQISF